LQCILQQTAQDEVPGEQRENKTFGGCVAEAAAYWLMDQSLLTRAILVRNPLLILTQPQTYTDSWYLNFFPLPVIQ